MSRKQCADDRYRRWENCNIPNDEWEQIGQSSVAHLMSGLVFADLRECGIDRTSALAAWKRQEDLLMPMLDAIEEKRGYSEHVVETWRRWKDPLDNMRGAIGRLLMQTVFDCCRQNKFATPAEVQFAKDIGAMSPDLEFELINEAKDGEISYVSSGRGLAQKQVDANLGTSRRKHLCNLGRRCEALGLVSAADVQDGWGDSLSASFDPAK